MEARCDAAAEGRSQSGGWCSLPTLKAPSVAWLLDAPLRAGSESYRLSVVSVGMEGAASGRRMARCSPLRRATVSVLEIGEHLLEDGDGFRLGLIQLGVIVGIVRIAICVAEGLAKPALFANQSPEIAQPLIAAEELADNILERRLELEQPLV